MKIGQSQNTSYEKSSSTNPNCEEFSNDVFPCNQASTTSSHIIEHIRGVLLAHEDGTSQILRRKTRDKRETIFPLLNVLHQLERCNTLPQGTGHQGTGHWRPRNTMVNHQLLREFHVLFFGQMSEQIVMRFIPRRLVTAEVVNANKCTNYDTNDSVVPFTVL